MQLSTIFLAAGLALTASAAPFSGLPAYVNSITSLAKSMESMCDVSTLSQPPAATTALSSPTGKLALVAIGKGTQNYTCPEPANPTATPTAIGAIATLFNASCLAAHTSADELSMMVDGVKLLPADSPLLYVLPVVGHHYFYDMTTPAFDLTKTDLGLVHSKKNASTPAPTTATNAVPWLELNAVPGWTQSKVSQVYRLETVDGNAPATCGQQTGAFTVNYAAEYWFYTSE